MAMQHNAYSEGRAFAFFLRWEFVLCLLFIVVNIINIFLSPHYLDVPLLLGATATFLDKALIVLPIEYSLPYKAPLAYHSHMAGQVTPRRLEQ